MSNIVKIKRGLVANLANAGVVDGELKYATDENELYIGNGQTNIKIGGSSGVYSSIYHKYLRLIEGDTPFNELLIDYYSTDPTETTLSGASMQDRNLQTWIAENILNGETNVQLGRSYRLLSRGLSAVPQYPIITDCNLYYFSNRMTFNYIYWTVENGELKRVGASITLQTGGTYCTWGHAYVKKIGKVI